MEDLRRDFSCGEYTRLAVEARLDIDVNYDPGVFPEDGKAYIAAQRSGKNFSRKIVEHLQKQGHDVSYNDTQEILKILMDYSEEANLFTYLPPKERKNTFKRWLKEGSPERDRAFQLCFALKMDAAEVDEFFLKGYMQRSFNYKDSREAVYFYCFRKGLSYAHAQGLLEEYQRHAERFRTGNEVETIMVGRAISEINTDEQLLEYLYFHYYEPTQQNLTIANRIKELIEECKPLARAEYEYYRTDFTDSDEHMRKMGKMNSVDALLTQITGFDEVNMREYHLEAALSEQEKEKFKANLPIYKKKLSKYLKEQRNAFEEVIGKNFPARATLMAIENGEAVDKPEKLYKALVLLEFYAFYGTLFCKSLEDYKHGRSTIVPDGANYMRYADEFRDVLDDSLARCGYGRAYDLNPYIEPFLICAGCPNPLNIFREFINEYYLEKFEPPFEIRKTGNGDKSNSV